MAIDATLLTANISGINWRSLSHDEIDALLSARTAAYEAAISARGGKRPKREGYVVERVASMANLREADAKAQRGKKKRRIVCDGKVEYVPNRYILRHNERAEAELRELQMMILTNEFPPCVYTTQEVKTASGKSRTIIKQNYYPWRILQHAILNTIGERVEKSFISGTFACIKGKGIHYGVRMMKRALRLHRELRWFWKSDFKKFYQSIPHELIEAEFRAMFKDEFFIRLIQSTLFSYKSGEELNETLANEAIRTKRYADWCCHESAHRQSCGEANRPQDESQR